MLLRDDPGLATFIRYVAQPVGQVYIRLLFMLVIPLVLPALALGVAGLGDLRRVGRIGMRTLAYTVVVSTIAVLLGLGLTNLLRPGDGMSEVARHVGRGGGAARGGPRAALFRSRAWTCSCRSCRETRSRRWPRATCWR